MWCLLMNGKGPWGQGTEGSGSGVGPPHRNLMLEYQKSKDLWTSLNAPFKVSHPVAFTWWWSGRESKVCSNYREPTFPVLVLVNLPPLCNVAEMQKSQASKLWCLILGCFVKRVSLHSLGWTLAVTAPSLLKSPIPFFSRLSVFADMSFWSWDFVPSLSLQSYIPSSYSPSSSLLLFLQLSSPSLSPSVSLHISLGLVPLIKRSCRAHRKAPLFPHCYINWHAVFSQAPGPVDFFGWRQ